MKRVILLLVLPFIAVATTFGQKISYGVHTGINISGYHGGDANRVYDNSTKVGGEVGGDFNYHFTPHWMLMSGLNFAQSGGRFAVMSPYAMSAYAEEFKEVNTRVLSFEILAKGIGLLFVSITLPVTCWAWTNTTNCNNKQIKNIFLIDIIALSNQFVLQSYKK